MRFVRHAFAVALISLIATGCASPFVDMTKTSEGIEPPTDPNKVQILFTKPEGHFTELASVTSTGWPTGDTAKMLNALRAKAASLGADAVLITNSGLSPDPFWGPSVMEM